MSASRLIFQATRHNRHAWSCVRRMTSSRHAQRPAAHQSHTLLGLQSRVHAESSRVCIRRLHQQDPERRSSRAGDHSAVGDSASGKSRLMQLTCTASVTAVPGGILYTYTTPEATKHERAVSYARLRDACACKSCVDVNTRQKSHRSSSSLASQVQTVLPSEALRVSEGGLEIRWPHDGHESFYSSSWLSDHLGAGALRAKRRADEIMQPVTWSGDELFTSPNPTLELSSIQSNPSTRHSALLQLQKYGYLKITGVGTAETSDASCALRTEVAPLFGEIRNTFYGGTWDVKSLKKSRNVAYTDVDLGLHMDLLYFQNPPRFQLLHCLRNRVHGGQSYFVDSFRAAEELRRSDPVAFGLLAESPIAFHYDNDGYHYRYSHPTIELIPDSTQIRAVNYSPPFQRWQPDPCTAQRSGEEALSHDLSIYRALETFERLLDADEHRVAYTLREGECVVFDNRRVLHARRRFWDKDQDPGGGAATRWLKGCYIDGDAVWNTLRYIDRRVVRGEIELASGWDEVL